MAPKEYSKRHYNDMLYYRDQQKTVFHRERGLPALEYFDGDKDYLENDTRHRLDGLAYDLFFDKSYYLNGKKLFTKLNYDA